MQVDATVMTTRPRLNREVEHTDEVIQPVNLVIDLEIWGHVDNAQSSPLHLECIKIDQLLVVIAFDDDLLPINLLQQLNGDAKITESNVAENVELVVIGND